MPNYRFEAMDATGKEIKDEIIAENEEVAQRKIRQLGYFVTRIWVDKPANDGTMLPHDHLTQASTMELIEEIVVRNTERVSKFFYHLLPTRKCPCCTGKCND